MQADSDEIRIDSIIPDNNWESEEFAGLPLLLQHRRGAYVNLKSRNVRRKSKNTTCDDLSSKTKLV